MGAYFHSHTFEEIYTNFIITPIIKIEQEIGYVSPFYKYNVIYTLTL